MRKILCIKCSLEFPNEPAYKQHKLEVHGGRVPGAEQELPEGIPESALPNQDFLDAVQRLENPPVKAGQIIEYDSNPPIVKIEPKPIKLSYVFSGNCPDCMCAVTTLELDIEKKHIVIAFCPQEQKQLVLRKVAPLKEEIK